VNHPLFIIFDLFKARLVDPDDGDDLAGLGKSWLRRQVDVPVRGAHGIKVARWRRPDGHQEFRKL